MVQKNENPVAFISYTHDSEHHQNQVLEFANKLRSQGIDAVLDQYEESPQEGWPRWMDRQIRNADYVIMICTPVYFKRVMGEEIPGKGLGGIWESNLIYQHLYNEGGVNHKFIPVLFEGSSSYMDIPSPLQGATHYVGNTDSGFDKLYWRLRGVSTSAAKPELGKLRPMKEKERKTMFLTSLIDVKTWDDAKWKGCAYLVTYYGSELPILGFIFENKQAAKVILEQWKDALIHDQSHLDFYEELRIVLVNTDFGEDNDGYFVSIGTNPEGLMKRYKDFGVKVDYKESLFMMISRIHHFTPSADKRPKEMFLSQYHKKNKYALQIGYIEHGEIRLFEDFILEKTKLEERHISEISDEDMDVAILERYKEYKKS